MNPHTREIQFCFNKSFRKPAFGPQTVIFPSDFSECPAKIPNVRPRFPTSYRDFEPPAEISNVQPRCRTSTRASECPAAISNVGCLECWKTATLLHFLRFWNSSMDSSNSGDSADFEDSADFADSRDSPETVSGAAFQIPPKPHGGVLG